MTTIHETSDIYIWMGHRFWQKLTNQPSTWMVATTNKFGTWIKQSLGPLEQRTLRIQGVIKWHQWQKGHPSPRCQYSKQCRQVPGTSIKTTMQYACFDTNSDKDGIHNWCTRCLLNKGGLHQWNCAAEGLDGMCIMNAKASTSRWKWDDNQGIIHLFHIPSSN